MKKLVILAAFGVAGLVNANTKELPSIQNYKTVKNSFDCDVLETETILNDCYTIAYVLSCGERIVDSYCESYDQIECDIMVIWEAWDNELC